LSLTFLNVLGDYFISHEKSGHVTYSKRGRMVALFNNATYKADAKSTSNV